ncbi:hypothetical protein ACJMK2_031761 [Sinanodonta woodiana]|uniref:adenylate cyclase n=1 Tax=Sinanodonta woodiana TaxID=1069815 RepID=A0ABD3X3Q9_SINWO
MQIVTCVREGREKKEYFYKPPINNITLAFLDSQMEENYRDHYLDETHTQNTLSAPKYHAFMEFLLSFLVFAIISIFCFIVFGSQLPWILVFIVSLVLEVINLVRSIATIKWHNSEDQGFCWKVSHVTAGWYLRNILGAITVSLPIIAVYSNFSCDLMTYSAWTDRFFCFCIMVSLLHYTNFTTLSSWVKTVLAGIAGIVLIIFLTLKVCASKDALAGTAASVSSVVLLNSTTEMMVTSTTDTTTASNLSKEVYVFSAIHNLQFEIIVDMLLLLLLIGFLNRESEISYRLNFQGDAQAWNVKQQMQENKDQADWLLHNIIPEHVSDKVRKTSKYSKNHKDVGVIFAAIVNFNEIYDESYEGGREFLRVLNELVSDYEELLDDPRFKDVEKIKTISSTFMAASGLNEQSRAQNKHPYSHLYSLMEFSIEMQNAVKRFNESIFNFAFILNIGYNYGEVTAGVIGTTKLLYDIWGDTVNIASRMYSTGVKERIQVPEATAKLLEDKFEFEYRGEISVKGKGEMLTYLLVKKIEGATWN